MTNILLIGSSGFVGDIVSDAFKSGDHKILTPTHKDLDITDPESILQYMHKADVVINFAAFTNVQEATLDPTGPNWKLNVDGAGNVARVCKETGKFLIHISTDAVFSIADSSKGPHSETEQLVDDPTLVSIYGYTKLKGETEVNLSGAAAAILRISYPFGNPKFPEKDYAIKLIKFIKMGYPLFDDQKFTPTYLKSLPMVIEKIHTKRLPGIFHWACQELTTAYKVGSYLNSRLEMGLSVKKGYLEDFEKLKGKQPYAKHGGLSTDLTEKRLGLVNNTWKEAFDDYMPELKTAL